MKGKIPGKVIHSQQTYTGVPEKNISLYELKGKAMGKKTVEEKPHLEQQFDQVMGKITGWKKESQVGSQTGPWILLLIGAVVTTLGFFSGFFRGLTSGFIAGIIGILIIIASWIWSGRRSKGQRNVEDKILTMKGDLSRLEKER